VRRARIPIPTLEVVAVAAVAAACLAAAVVTAAETADRFDGLRGGAKVQAVIDAVVEQQAAVRSLRAEFVQLKESELLLEPVRSRGRFSYLAPDRVRWDYESPDTMVVVFDADTVTTYHPDRLRAEQVRIPRRHRKFVQALAGAQPLNELAAQFSVTMTDPGAPAPYRLELRPTHAALAARLDSVDIDVDRGLLLPVVVEYHEADGDTTRYEFRDLELNPGLSVSDFQLELAEGVEVETLDAS
jgi:outer membrane lipoprotein carrier protein